MHHGLKQREMDEMRGLKENWQPNQILSSSDRMEAAENVTETNYC